jgi:two-component system, LytTR family, sensor kinase
MLAPALSASSVTCELRVISGMTPRSQEVPILTTDPPHYVLTVGELAGGRRLLSDDSHMLDRVAIMVARRIDALRLTDERYERMLRERDMQTLATEAELRALRAQINPHFLFNALTTIGYLIQQAPPQALDTLLRLTTLLRGVLRSEGEFTTLGHECELIECYLQIEQERFEERLRLHIDIPDDLRHLLIPSLIVQPLVENAIKHGVAPALDGGAVRVMARVRGGSHAPSLSISVHNTGAPLRGRVSAGGGVGLLNVERRLACYYGDGARFELRADPDLATVAELVLPLHDPDTPSVTSAPQATVT